jgi:hypothetical protein
MAGCVHVICRSDTDVHIAVCTEAHIFTYKFQEHCHTASNDFCTEKYTKSSWLAAYVICKSDIAMCTEAYIYKVQVKYTAECWGKVPRGKA